MSWSRSPHSIGASLGWVRRRAEPRTLLAAAQSAWPGAVGRAVADQAEPVAEREGVLTIACRSATWAQELDLMQEELLARLRRRLSEDRDDRVGEALRGVRFTADASRHFPS